MDRLLAELMGKETGINEGKGGSMHLSDFGVGSLGETSIVGSGLPVATGAALGSKLLGDGRVTLCFFGDGASNEGTFHESLNLASIWTLPVVYVCENNGYGEMTSTAAALSVANVADRASAYSLPASIVDGQDVGAVYDTVGEAVGRARAGDGPTLVETKTYRFDNHAVGLSVENYRDPAEVQDWIARRDPLQLFHERAADYGLDEHDLARIDKEVADEVAAAVEFARSGPLPPPEAAFTHLFTNPIPIRRQEA